MNHLLRVRINERTDFVYLDHIANLRSRNPLWKAYQWVRLQLFGETRRRVDRDRPARPAQQGPMTPPDREMHDHVHFF